MDSLDQRFEDGQAIRAQMAQDDPSQYSLPGTEGEVERLIYENHWNTI
jgi:hypothetical protein